MALADAGIEAAAIDVTASAVAGAVAVREALVTGVRGKGFRVLGRSHGCRWMSNIKYRSSE